MKKLIILVFTLIVLLLTTPFIGKADVAGLSTCKDSANFHHRLDANIKKLENRLTKYDAETPPFLALEEQLKKTKIRFERYEKSSVLCGTDGLPQLIVDGRWSHAGEFILPAILFLYISGWIGWVGRNYLQIIKKYNKPTEKEIIIDIPIALSCMVSGILWPFSALQELTNNKLVANVDEITVSPR
uniref:Photosystem I reaction center subunit III n=1 Tax=Boldia erythrosiphon TaxID=74908 RepID=A0A1Y9TLY8_9RHOD|nr:photosystem I subunit III [Boldia erythrosiphon]ARO90681.1 photosystem I subunit III [Boldia erythrosiphon]